MSNDTHIPVYIPVPDNFSADEPVPLDDKKSHPHPPKNHNQTPKNPRHVRIVSHALNQVHELPLGATPVDFPEGGTGGWVATARPNDVSMTNWTGVDPLTMIFSVMLDGHSQNFQNLDQVLTDLIKLGQHRGGPKPDGRAPRPFRLYSRAFHPYSGESWVMTNPLGYQNRIQHIRDGQITRQELVFQVMRFVDPDDIKIVNANARYDQGAHVIGGTTGGGYGANKRYIVKKGDNLFKIAQKFYGDQSKWRQIARRNGVKNPRSLTVGTVLIIPGVG